MGTHPGMGIPSFITQDKIELEKKDKRIKELKEEVKLLKAQIELMKKHVPELG